MSEQTSEGLRVWFRQVESFYPEMFNMAHALCGNYDQAEYAMRSAILEVWLQSNSTGIGFRERLLMATREAVFQLLREEGAAEALTWSGFTPLSEDVISRCAIQENLEVQRMLMLRYGAQLTPSRVARIMNVESSAVRAGLERFKARCCRQLPAQDRERFDILMRRFIQGQLNARISIPQASLVYRAFEAEASQYQAPQRRVSQFLYRLVLFLMVALCALMFWLFAVLLQVPVVQATATTQNAINNTAYIAEASA